jgi:hypothetical protein
VIAKSSRRGLRALGILACALSSACAPRLLKLPSGPGTPAPDGQEALADATRACRAITTITAEIGVSGSVGGRRFRTRLTAGLAPPASARLEAAAPFGAPLFILVAVDNDATVLLPHDGRVLSHAPSASVLEALAGLPLDVADLRVALIGCTKAANAAAARQLGADWRVVPDGPDEIYLQRDKASSRWRLAAAVHHPSTGTPWRAEYRDFQTDLPQSVRFVGSAPDSFDLRLALSQVETNVALGAEVFRVDVPADADPITIDELRRARPGVRQD